MTRTHLSLPEARRAAIRAQGLHKPPAADQPTPTARRLRSVAQRMGIVQIDSVNVLARAHLLTLYARLGAFHSDTLDRVAYGGLQRGLFEYWGHEASLLPVDTFQLWQWRMQDARAGNGIYSGLARFRKDNAKFIDAVLAEVEQRGPLSARELSDGGTSRGSWWGWSEGKRAIEWLFWAGLVSTHTRRNTFERVYDITERVLPDEIVRAATPTRSDAQRELLRRALAASGVATEKDLRDYLRLSVSDTRVGLSELIDSGGALPVQVEGWGSAYMAPDARVPRRVHSRALLCPFDPLIWTRDRTERLFGMRYRLEIYVPAAKRVHGYYVLPFLMDDALVARVDLKADRQASKLRVRAAHREDDAPDHTPMELAAALRNLADWLGLTDVVVERRGGLADALRQACRARS